MGGLIGSSQVLPRLLDIDRSAFDVGQVPLTSICRIGFACCFVRDVEEFHIDLKLLGAGDRLI